MDKLTIENEPITSIQLMERASSRFTNWFVRHFDTKYRAIVFAGTGNNGGDALAIARMLIERQYEVKVYLVMTSGILSDDCAINLKKIKVYTDPVILDIGYNIVFPSFNNEDIIIDGIFGCGLNRPAEGIAAQIIGDINRSEATVVSIDIPSGLFGEDNRGNKAENIIKASFTVSFSFPFLSFFIVENEDFIGQWEIIDIGLHRESIEKLDADYFTIEADTVCKLILPRKKFSHKGSYGHALVIAGKKGMMGAAVLSGKASLRGGAGLTTICAPDSGCDIIQTIVPEALTQCGGIDTFSQLPDLKPYQAIACGPAIGQNPETALALHDLLLQAKVALVLDADALNILAEHKEWINHLPEGSVITPHPREFDRLAGSSSDMYSRHLRQVEFAKKYNLIVILKGAHTIVTVPEGKSFINTSGNPGMATGGTGDVLTGLLVSLLAQGYSPVDASIIAVFIHGLAGDIALENSSMEALTAGDIIEKIGLAFRRVKGSG
jgi:NAD(P)H-hydrate epimerase